MIILKYRQKMECMLKEGIELIDISLRSVFELRSKKLLMICFL